MEQWQRSLEHSLCKAEQLSSLFDIPEEDIRKVEKYFKFRISPHYLSLIKEKNSPIYRQSIPDLRELEGNTDLMNDPLGEEKNSPVPGIVHRYPDRCLFLVSANCAMYCRFCTRKRKFAKDNHIDESAIDRGLDYIRSHSEIRDVLVSGGDPFLLTDSRIDFILSNLRAIAHVEIIRIGTRTPCVLPERITPELVTILKRYHPLYVIVHFNHPEELVSESVAALARLADAGIPLASQTVLLKGVNDDPQVMKHLMQKLLQARVRPYYLHQTDLVYGTEHFRTPISKGLEIIRSLQDWTSGLAVPHYVIDLPGGGGKVPLIPEYIKEINGNEITFINYRGEEWTYKDIPESSNVPSAF